MELSLFYAKLIGFYLLIAAICMLINAKVYKNLIIESSHNQSLTILFGVFSLIFGLVIVLTHNIWVGWPIIVTLLGYLSVVVGIIRLGFTDWVEHMAPGFAEYKPYLVTTVVSLILGLILLYFGYR